VDCFSKDRFSSSPKHSAASSSAHKKSNVSKEFVLFPDKPTTTTASTKQSSNQSLESYKLNNGSAYTLPPHPASALYSKPTGGYSSASQSFKPNPSQYNLTQLHTEEK